MEALPLQDKPDFSQQFKGLYALHAKVKDLPTHEVRKSQNKKQIKQQDLQREKFEAEFAPQILLEVAMLKTFSV